MTRIIKRDGRIVEFDSSKIENAILKAFKEVDGEISEYAKLKAKNIANYIETVVRESDEKYGVEDIQDLCEKGLMSTKRKDVAKAYVLYRQERTRARENPTDSTVEGIVSSSNEYYLEENSNKNAILSTTQRDYIAGAVSIDMSDRKLLPKEVVKAHDEGIIHFHDKDYFLQKIHNCDLINLEDMLQYNSVISETLIERPKSFSTACNIATQIIAQVASSQYGGQSITLSHLAPFVDVSRQKFRKELKEEYETLVAENSLPFMPSEGAINATAEKRLQKEIEKGIQTIQYQVVTLMTTNGQAPFITVYLNLAEVPEGQLRDDLAAIIKETLRQRIKGVKNEKGVYVTPAFPKLIYALDEINIHEDSPYYDVTLLAAECSAKRMVPDYMSNKIQLALKGDLFPAMGCRSSLTKDSCTENYANANNWVKGHKYYGRFNQGVVTLNLVDVACSSNKDMDKFWSILEERLELCHTALRCRHERLKGTTTDSAPILWQHGALARLPKHATIDELLMHNYSTISLGYAGIYEMTYYMLGESHTTEKGREFALKVMQRLNDACEEWRAKEDIGYSLYGTPLESTTYKFAKCLKERFGIIPEVTDHNYITNSYHVNVREKIDAFEKLKQESEFQRLSQGGAISYVEVPNLADNIPAVIEIIKFIYDNIMYAEINSKFDYCHECGYNGEIKIKKDDTTGKLYWECPNCGNTDKEKMNVARRTCGYIGTQFWNQGRTEEIRDRVLHLE